MQHMVNYYISKAGLGGSGCKIKWLFGWNDKRDKENNTSSNDAEDHENKEKDKFEKYGITQDKICGSHVNTNGWEKDKQKIGIVVMHKQKEEKTAKNCKQKKIIKEQQPGAAKQDISDFDNYQRLLNVDICGSLIRCFNDNGIEHVSQYVYFMI